MYALGIPVYPAYTGGDIGSEQPVGDLAYPVHLPDKNTVLVCCFQSCKDTDGIKIYKSFNRQDILKPFRHYLPE